MHVASVHPLAKRVIFCLAAALAWGPLRATPAARENLKGEEPALAAHFVRPPDSSRPGVYWYFLDGNRDRAAMTADLEAMAKAGLGSVIYLEVDLGVPRGPVPFMSEPWQDLFVHAVREAERLGLEIILGSGPGWAGSGGPWVKPEDSMQHLVAGTTLVSGPRQFHEPLAVPPPRKPYFDTITSPLNEQRQRYYRDVAVLAFPTPIVAARIADADAKALFYRAPYTSTPGVLPYLPPPAPQATPAGAGIDPGRVIDLTSHLSPDGTLDWQVPAGNWTIMRFVARNNGANTRPAPQAGYGFECDKFSAQALDAHLAEYTDRLLKKVGERRTDCGWTMMHIDSWEMGAQNWTPAFRQEFQRRRGYDPQPWYPAYAGQVIGTTELTERFLWDVRQTAQELVLENHAGHLKEFAHRHRMGLSIEPYDMNPAADLALGSVADVPMGEFWANGFNSSFSCIEAASVAHTMGRPVVGAESFTSEDSFVLYPAMMKNQLDWAFATGINRILFHTFQHQPLGEAVLPGLTFGPYGVNWQRNQTWWPMVDGVHRYIGRCSYLLRQGVTVADILYLTPEGAPQVFRAPASALADDDPRLPDRRGYNFDGCAPSTLIDRAEVREGRIAFPGGSEYRLLVLPAVETMTPALLAKIKTLVEQGATVVGQPPLRSPSLSGYPACDETVRATALALWGGTTAPDARTERPRGDGRLFWGGELRMNAAVPPDDLYPAYDATAQVLRELKLPPDFESSGAVRYTHRRTETKDIYFVSNRSEHEIAADCTFRVTAALPELWDPMTGEIRALGTFVENRETTTVPLRFAPHQSYFVVFGRNGTVTRNDPALPAQPNFRPFVTAMTLEGPWDVSFPPGRGAPAHVRFQQLEDWTSRSEPGIRYFSGIATYRKNFDLPVVIKPSPNARIFLDLGVVKDICRVRINGHDLGAIWTAPWRIDIGGVAKATGNQLEIDVANRWPNRLIGDQQPADANARTLSWKSGLLGGKEFKTGRYTFVLTHPYKATSPLLSAGLLGPVTVEIEP